jgi:hypothetical protein
MSGTTLISFFVQRVHSQNERSSVHVFVQRQLTPVVSPLSKKCREIFILAQRGRLCSLTPEYLSKIRVVEISEKNGIMLLSRQDGKLPKKWHQIIEKI